jgi:hypothetical protein
MSVGIESKPSISEQVVLPGNEAIGAFHCVGRTVGKLAPDAVDQKRFDAGGNHKSLGRRDEMARELDVGVQPAPFAERGADGIQRRNRREPVP